MENKLASIVLGVVDENDRFDVRHYGLTFKLGIKALSPNTIIRIGKEFAKCKEIKDGEQTVFQAMLGVSDNWWFICKSIAIATGHPFTWLIAKIISKLPAKDVGTLWEAVMRNTDAELFFSIITSAKKMNFMKAKEE